MATLAERVISILKAEVGVKESPAGSNNVKYNTEYYGRTVSGDYPWCVVFLWWGFKQAEESLLFYEGGKTASCPTLANWAKNKGKYVTSGYEVGDLMFFSWDKSDPYQHVGIVESVASDGSVTTIEGNTSVTSNDNGGAVMRRTRTLTYTVGAYRPDYKGSGVTPSPGPIIDTSVAGTYVVTAKTGLNVRTGPGTQYSIVGAMEYNSAVTVTGSSGNWYVVKYSGTTGYSSAEYLSKKTAGTYKVTAKSGLFVRSGPGTSYSKLGGLAYNTRVEVTGKSADGGWYTLQYQGRTGYCSADYLIRV